MPPLRPLPGREFRITEDTPPFVTRQALYDDQHLRILRAVGELAAERGYGNFTLKTIVRRAHVTYRTFYAHFRNKEHCLIALFDNAVRATEAEIVRRLGLQARPWPQRVALAIDTVVELTLAEPQIARAVVVEAPKVRPGGVEQHEIAARVLVPLFREGREISPRGADQHPRLELALAGSVIWSLYQALLVEEAETLPALGLALTELVVRTFSSDVPPRRLHGAYVWRPAATQSET